MGHNIFIGLTDGVNYFNTNYHAFNGDAINDKTEQLVDDIENYSLAIFYYCLEV
jgi:hypothetical protein